MDGGLSTAAVIVLVLVLILSLTFFFLLPRRKLQEIQEATASEPLTLEEEYAMQRSWRDDGDKLTFIVCRPHQHHHHHHHRHDDERGNGCSVREEGELQTPREGRGGGGEGEEEEAEEPFDLHLQREVDAMVGDVNLFISTASTAEDGSEDENEHHPGFGQHVVVGELELMIAEAAHQGRGYGRAAVLAFLEYIARHEDQILAEFQREAVDEDDDHHHQHDSIAPSPSPSTAPGTLQLRHFDHICVKIGGTNLRSMALFESLAFRKTSDGPSYFGEYELRLSRAGLEDVLLAASHNDGGLLEGYCEAGAECGRTGNYYIVAADPFEITGKAT
ncbi:hypothetical protein AYL99_10604 [Fonsecaea erecta]|uniref:Uncharacterized protein n=1 Tax=Fonsecaea erecta TaxID=1367422 RepID=A0A178Z562_9EURO|nr:hypothetical protein AYL99_10604 [Fonsecaea erecta]OAP54904.1 hypothetical protein AYL99_10604 [Fonsecaea erecta]